MPFLGIQELGNESACNRSDQDGDITVVVNVHRTVSTMDADPLPREFLAMRV